MANILFLSLLIIVQFLALASTLETLGSVQILFSHGEKEPDGLNGVTVGPLTDNGKRQMYELGLKLRSRYEGLVRIEFDSTETSFLSSDQDATLQSASLVAYGLYRDFNLAATWSGDENIEYEPIPVRSIPQQYDNLLQLTKACPKNQAQTQGCLNSLKGNSTEGSQNLLSLNSEELSSCYLDTEANQRLYIGPFIKNLLAELDVIPPKKISLYSGHDRTLFSLMKTLGIQEDSSSERMPPDGAALIVEHFQPIGFLNSGSYLKFWYQNSTGDATYLPATACGEPCYVNKFKEVFAGVIPENAEQECKLPPATTTTTTTTTVTTRSPRDRLVDRIRNRFRTTTTTERSNKVQPPFPQDPRVYQFGPENQYPVMLKAPAPAVANSEEGSSALTVALSIIGVVGIAGAVIFMLYRKRRSYYTQL